MSEQKSFEKALKRLEEIVSKLEKGDISLEESISLYEEGMKLVKFCQNRLEEIEGKIKIITGKDDKGLILEDF